LDPRYSAEKVGPFWLFVKKELLLEEAQREASTDSESFETSGTLEGQ
jgi:hypothetical protein